MTDVPETHLDGSRTPAREAVHASVPKRIAAQLAALVKRSTANRRQTMAKIANRRLWRPAIYPRTDWKAWLCYAVALIVVVGAVLDQPVGSFGRQWPQSLVAAADVATRAALSGWYLYPAALILLVVNLTDWSMARGRRLLRLYNWTSLALFVLLSIGIPGLIGTFLKHAIGRARPLYFAENGAFSFHSFAGSSTYASMPSGHSCTIGSVAMMLILVFPASRYVVVPGALALAATRVVLFSHYPSDVVAGLALGSSFTLIIACVFARLGYIFTATTTGLPKRRKSFSVFW